jgi:plasmid stability protein
MHMYDEDMSMLNRRTQILLDEERYARLERRARQTGRSVAAVIREAIDDALLEEELAGQRRAAGRWLLDQPLPTDPEPDWSETKRELHDRAGDAPGA